MLSWKLNQAKGFFFRRQALNEAKACFEQAIHLLENNPTFNSISSVSRLSMAEALLQYGDLVYETDERSPQRLAAKILRDIESLKA